MQVYIKFIAGILLLSLGSCKKQEKLYTQEEAYRIADSLAQIEIEQRIQEIESDFEYRKKVELPYRFGVNRNAIFFGEDETELQEYTDSLSEETRVKAMEERGLQPLTADSLK